MLHNTKDIPGHQNEAGKNKIDFKVADNILSMELLMHMRGST
tara:strand:+ start:1176 stop:1301 length:126 start_codon:yes stop_codon:yes gene_type:complete